LPIRVLSESVASKIAAGEVVERPASVVKELIENAIDADATEIKIRIKDSGKHLIEVADNGIGIPAEELQLAVSRYATSKISSAEDLQRISTLGFRGEALASIAAISYLQISSRSKHEEVGAKLIVEAGKIISRKKAGLPVGTRVLVENLFVNVPARLEFLKSDMTERRHIARLITRYAMAYPHIRFNHLDRNKKVLQTSGNGNRREVMAQIYRLDLAKQMLEISFRDDSLTIEGLISPIEFSRSNRKEIVFFVNGRWVQNIALSSACVNAYHTYLMVGRYPTALLFLSIMPGEVDVNVHPTKAQVRFRGKNRVFSAVTRAVRRTLLAYSPVPSITPSIWHSYNQTEQRDPLDWHFAHDIESKESAIQITQPSEIGAHLSQLEITEKKGLPLLRSIGQIGATYIVAEGPDGLYLIDQHAAHERVLYERLMESINKKGTSQLLLEPEVLDLNLEDTILLRKIMPALNTIGFQIEEFGKTVFRIRAVPGQLAHVDPLGLIHSALEQSGDGKQFLRPEKEKMLIARICKGASVKGGQVLSKEEQSKLLRDLESCQNPRTCPHGRPTMIHLSVDLLERQFGRRGSR